MPKTTPLERNERISTFLRSTIQLLVKLTQEHEDSMCFTLQANKEVFTLPCLMMLQSSFYNSRKKTFLEIFE